MQRTHHREVHTSLVAKSLIVSMSFSDSLASWKQTISVRIHTVASWLGRPPDAAVAAVWRFSSNRGSLTSLEALQHLVKGPTAISQQPSEAIDIV